MKKISELKKGVQSLKNDALKDVGEEVFEVIISFPEYVPIIANVEAVEE